MNEVLRLRKTLELNNYINSFKIFLGENLLDEQKHSILLVEDFQKNLIANQEVDSNILEALTTAYGRLSEKQQKINDEFLKLKQTIDNFSL